jgi:WD40 repeat protein
MRVLREVVPGSGGAAQLVLDSPAGYGMSVARTSSARAGASAWSYDAFLSYSHAADSRLAPMLQRALQRLTRAWYQRQALRVFRDQASLAANPDLWGTVERALRESHYFVLLASPEAARSEWVAREVAWWQEHRERATFLIALTDGTIRWDNRAGDFDWASTDALPDGLRGWFPREPLWVDLTWTRAVATGELSLRHTRFRDNVGTLAAAIHGRRKDQIDSEDARRHRRATLLSRAVIVVLAALLVISGIATINANVERGVADQQRTAADQQRTAATERALEAEAQNTAATQPQTSLELSLAALRMDPSAQVRATLVNTLLQTHYDGSSPPETSAFSSINEAAFSPDGRMLATDTGENDDVLLWNTADPVDPVKIAAIPADPNTSAGDGLAFSRDGQLLAIATAGSTVALWNVAHAPRRLATLTVPDAQAVAFSPDGKTLAVVGGNSADGTLALWDISNPAAPSRLAARDGVYFPDAVAFSPDGTLLVTASGTITGSNSGTITGHTRTTFWDITSLGSPRPVATIPVWDGDGGIAFSPDGRTLALALGSEASLWNVTNPAQPGLLATLVGHTDDIVAMAFSPDGQTLATAGLDNNAILWNTADPAHATREATLAGDTQPIAAVAFAGGGKTLVTADWETEVFSWQVASAEPSLAATLTGGSGGVQSVAVSPDSTMAATANYDNSVILWNITNPAQPTVLARLATDAGPVSAVAFNPDGTILAAGSWDNQMTLWDVSDRSRPRQIATVSCPGEVGWIAFSPGGETLAAGGDPFAQGFPVLSGPGWATLWNVSDPPRPAILHQFSDGGGTEYGALSPDGKILVLSASGTNLESPPSQVWDVSDPAHPTALPDPDNALTEPFETDFGDDPTFSANGRYVATAGIGTNGDENPVVLWSAAEPSRARQLVELTGPSQQISMIAFHPGGNLVAAASSDFTTTVWDIADTSQPFVVETFSDHDDIVNALAFSPDGRLLLDASDDGTANVWDLGGLPAIAAGPVGLACQITGGGFTQSQWGQNAPGVPYQRSCPA